MGLFFAIRKIIQIFLQHKLSLEQEALAYDALFPNQQNSLYFIVSVRQ